MALATVVAIGAVGALIYETLFGTAKPGSGGGSKGGSVPTPTPGKGKGTTPTPGGVPPFVSGDRPQPRPAAHDPRIDADMPSALAAITIALLDSDTVTAEQLNAAAQAAELAGFEVAAASLRLKASELGGAPAGGEPAPGSAEALAADFESMPDPPRSDVEAMLATETNLGTLDSEADEAATQGYTEIANAFRAKAAMIRAAGGGIVPETPPFGGGFTPGKPGQIPPNVEGPMPPAGAGPQQIAAAIAATEKANADFAAAIASGDAVAIGMAAQEQAAAMQQQIAINMALAAAGQPPIMFPSVGA